jgi:hypothetical protein
MNIPMKILFKFYFNINFQFYFKFYYLIKKMTSDIYILSDHWEPITCSSVRQLIRKEREERRTGIGHQTNFFFRFELNKFETIEMIIRWPVVLVIWSWHEIICAEQLKQTILIFNIVKNEKKMRKFPRDIIFFFQI